MAPTPQPPLAHWDPTLDVWLESDADPGETLFSVPSAVFSATLADIGYDAQWEGLLAADPRVGACHPRFRVFLGAFPRELDRRELLEHLGILGLAQDPDESARGQRGLSGSGEAEGGRARADARRRGRDLLPTPRATDGEKGGPNQRGSSGDLMLPSAVAQLPEDAQLLGTPVARDGKGVSHDTPRLEAAAKRGKVEAQLLLLPTPVAAEGEKASLSGSARTRIEEGHQPFLTHAIGDVTRDQLLPTPITADASGARANAGGNPMLSGIFEGYHQSDLDRLGDRAQTEKLLPTPVTTDAFGAARHTTTTGVAHPGTSLTDWTRIIEVVQAEADGEELLPTPRAGNGMNVPLRPHSDDTSRLEDAVAVHLLPTPTDSLGSGGQTSRSGDRKGEALLGGIDALLPTPMVGGGEASHGQISGQYREAMAAAFARWGDYAPAIARWETVTGRPAPEPTQWSESYKRERARRLAGEDKRPVGRRGSLKPRSQLSARFVEWMMGLPEGWVTDVPDVSRNQALKALGNGVVPQQAATALALMLGHLIAELEEAEAS